MSSFRAFLFSLAALLPAALPVVAQVAETTANSTSIEVNVSTMTNRHPISPYIYGANFPPNAAYVTQSGATLVRWGGNNSTNYNWKTGYTNLDNDWYFENNVFSTGTGIYASSAAFLSGVSGAGGSPILTIPMINWAAKDKTSYSFSVAKYGQQCATDYWNSDAGNGMLPGCSTPLTGNDVHDAYLPLLNAPSASDPAGSIYRSQWIAAVKGDYGTQPHFYNLDNEPDIWGGTHRDVHPKATGYDEMASTFVAEARAIKSYDPLAVRFGPTFCCWWYYWNGANSNDKGDHGGLDFLPWLLNEIYFEDQAAGVRSLDVFDVHAYFNGPSPTTLASARAAALRETRDWWDATYVSENGTVNQPWATLLQPDKTVAFVIPRMRALANSIYPGTPVAFTEWNGSQSVNYASLGDSDISTALADVDAYGILGRERIWAASRWTAATLGTPSFQSLLLYRNADGKHDGFQSVSVSATDNASPNLFSVFGATNEAGTQLTLMVVNKDPVNTASTTLNIAGFTPSEMTTYTLSSAKPTAIVASASKPWSATQSFAPYSATLIVASGTSPEKVGAEWDLVPDTLTVPAGGTASVAVKITDEVTPGTTVKLTGSNATGGVVIGLNQPNVMTNWNGLVTLKAPTTPGLYSFNIFAKDSAGISQSKHGWLLVGNPPSTLTLATTAPQPAPRGTKITLIAKFVPGTSSGATGGNVSILFSTSAGTLSSKVVRTDPSGDATVTLTLPATAGKVTVKAQEPIPWGGEIATFTVTSQ